MRLSVVASITVAWVVIVLIHPVRSGCTMCIASIDGVSFSGFAALDGFVGYQTTAYFTLTDTTSTFDLALHPSPYDGSAISCADAGKTIISGSVTGGSGAITIPIGLTQVLTAGKLYKLCSQAGGEVGLYLRMLPRVYSSLYSGSELPIPTSGQFGSWSFPIVLTSLYPPTGDEWKVYLAPVGSACNFNSRVLSLTAPSLANPRVTITSAIAASLAGTVTQVCFAGSSVLDISLAAVDGFKFAGRTLSSGISTKEITAYVQSAVPLSAEYTMSATATSTTAGMFYSCAVGGTAVLNKGSITSTQTSGVPSVADTVSVTALSSTTSIGVCFRFGSGTVLVSLSTVLVPFQVSSIAGVAAGGTPTHLPVITAATAPSTVWTLVLSGTAPSDHTIYLSTAAACATATSHSTVPFTTSLTLPSDWTAAAVETLYLCARTNSASPSVYFPLSPFALQVMVISGVVRSPLSVEPTTLQFLVTANTVLKLSGSFYASATSTVVVGYYDIAKSNPCTATATLAPSTGLVTVKNTEYASTSGVLCAVATSTSSMVTFKAFASDNVTSIGSYGLDAIFASSSAQPVPISFMLGDSAFTATVDFMVAPSCSASSGLAMSFASPYTVFTIVAPSAGLFQVCWRFAQPHSASDPYTAVDTLTVLPAPAPSNRSAFLRVSPTATLYFASALGTYLKTAALLSVGTMAFSSPSACSGTAITGFERAPVTGQSGSTLMVTVPSPSSPWTLQLCGLLFSATTDTATMESSLVHGVYLGAIQFVQMKLWAAPFPPTSTATTAPILFPLSSSTATATFSLGASLTFDASVAIGIHLSDCSATTTTMFSGSLTTLAQAGSVTISNVDALWQEDATAEVAFRLCGRFSSGGVNPAFADLSQTAAGVKLKSIDSMTIAFGDGVSGSTRAVWTVLSSAQRDIAVLGFNLHVASSRTMTLHADSTAGCSSVVDASMTMDTASPSSTQMTFPGRSATVYTLACFSFTDTLSGITHTVPTNFVVVVLPVAAFVQPLATGKQQTSIVGAVGMTTTIPVVMEAGNQLSDAFYSYYITNSTSCTNTTSADDFTLPFTSTALVINGTEFSAGHYTLCVRFGSSFAMASDSTWPTVGGTGFYLAMVYFTIGGAELNSGSAIGATTLEPVDLQIRGTYLTDAYIFVSFTDTTCGDKTGTTVYGNSRTPAAASGCGSTLASVTLDSIKTTTIAGSEMTVCFGLAPSTEPVLTASSVTLFDSGIQIAAAEPTELGIITDISSISNVDGSFARQPVLGLIDPTTGAVFASIPTDLVVTASWFVVSPIEEQANLASYEYRASKGESAMDFATQKPILLADAIHGYDYIVSFTATGDRPLTGTNSSSVRRGYCAPTELAEIYTKECVACPSSAECNGSMVFNVTDSVWRPHKYSKVTYSCKPPFAARTCQPFTETGSCPEGHDGVRCTVCVGDYAWATDQCLLCDSKIRSGIIVGLVALAFIVVVVALILSTLKCKKGDLFPLYFKVILNHITVASTVGQFQDSLSNSFEGISNYASSFFQVQKTLSRPSSDFAAFTCLTGFNWYVKFMVTNLIPVAFALGILVAIALRRRPKTVQEMRDELIRAALPDLEAESAAAAPPAKDEQPPAEAEKPTAVAEVGRKSPDEQFAQEGAATNGAVAEDSTIVVVEVDTQMKERVQYLWRRARLYAKAIGRMRRMGEAQGLLQVHALVGRQHASHIFAVCMVVVLFFTYPSLVEVCANVLKCDVIDYSYTNYTGDIVPESTSYFYYDRSKVCSSSEHRRYMAIASILGVWWGFGTPLLAILLYYYLRRPVAHGGIGNATASRMFTFLVAGYRRQFWWWEAVLMLRKFVVIYIAEFIWDLKLQNLVAFWAMTIFLILHTWVSPFEYRQLDIMERRSISVVCLTLTLSSLYDWVPLDHPDRKRSILGYSLTGFLLLINVAIILWMLKLLFGEMSNSLRKWLRNHEEKIRQKCCACCASCLLSMGHVAYSEGDVTVMESYSGFQRPDEDDDVSDWSDDEDDEDAGDANARDRGDERNAQYGATQETVWDDIQQFHEGVNDALVEPQGDVQAEHTMGEEAFVFGSGGEAAAARKRQQKQQKSVTVRTPPRTPPPGKSARGSPPPVQPPNAVPDDADPAMATRHPSHVPVSVGGSAAPTNPSLWALDTTDVIPVEGRHPELITLANGQAVPAATVHVMLQREMGAHFLSEVLRFIAARLKRPLTRAQLHREVNEKVGQQYERHATALMQLAAVHPH